MIDLLREALGVQEFLAESGWPFCFIGGVAVDARLAPLAQAKGDAAILDRVREIRTDFGD